MQATTKRRGEQVTAGQRGAERVTSSRRTHRDAAPASAGMGAVGAARWLGRLPRAWLRGWLAFARAAGAEPEHLVGPNPWLAKRAPSGPGGVARRSR
jgi:hypothetical protein